MAQNNQPKDRQQARDLRRKSAKRQPIERLLIVCEGSKTEPNYLNEIRQDLRLPTANVLVLPSEIGTDPLKVVIYAERLFCMAMHTRGLARDNLIAFMLCLTGMTTTLTWLRWQKRAS